MTTRRLAAAAFVCGLAVLACVVFSGDAFAAASAAAHAPREFNLIDMVVASPALLAMRARHDEAVTKARAKLAEIVDGLAPADVTRIETEHATLVRSAEDIQREIRAEETRIAAANPTQDPTEAVRLALSAERVRVSDIQAIGTRAGMDAAAINVAVRDGVAVDVFRTQAFDALAARSAVHPTSPTNVAITRDEQETRRRGMSAAIVARMARSAGERVEIPDYARAYGEMGMVEMAAEVVGHRGHIRNAAQAIEVFSRAFNTTSDFPGIFSDAVNVRLLARYQSAPATYRSIAANYNTTDFRPTNVIRAGDFPTLLPITESGEIKQGTFSESKEVFRVYPYGVGLPISRQMIINDNLGAIDQVLGSAGQRVVDWENAKVIAALLANAALLTDSVAMFHADHGNLPTAAAISVTSVGAGRAAMLKQTSLDGMMLNLMPSVLLTGPDKQTLAEQLLTSITPVTTRSDVVPEPMRKIVPLADGNIGTGTKWWLFADPKIAPVLVYGFLDGFQGPRLTVQQQFGQQGVVAQLEHDFGVAGIDYRGAVYNSGA